MSALPKPDFRDLRPSVVIAEALVDRQGPTEIADRARELGFSQCLTQAVVGACCRGVSLDETASAKTTATADHVHAS